MKVEYLGRLGSWFRLLRRLAQRIILVFFGIC